MAEQEQDVKKEQTSTVKGLAAFFQGQRSVSFIVLLGIAGIALIFISSSFHPSSSGGGAVQEEASDNETFSDYRSSLSEELGNMLASMSGVGRTKVMVTLDGTVRNVYATDVDVNDRQTSRKNGTDENADNQNTERRSCIVIRQKDGSEKALTVGKLLPEIKGVLVICEGGDDPQVCSEVIRAVSAALDIRETHICVSKLG